ncbi:hypothetical protein CRENBAI_007740 [Crenichthys baileyi]|uniref:Uncharacterized protein n=1 Tax=Crenichthys baileyi TaxID=28760 RepID=A0AAV9RLQ0_9TELE
MDLADDHQASSMDLFTFLSREAEKTLRRSAGLSVPQSAYDGSRLAIPCPGTGPLRRRSSPPLHTAVKPSSSSRRKKRRRGAPSCVSASEEKSPTPAAATPGAVTPLLAGGRVAASKPASSSATALSPRLAAAPPMPSSLAPAWCSEATPDELEQRLRFFARQIKSFRRTSLMYSSPELMERIRQMEGDYETAVRQFYCRPPSTLGLQGAAAAAAEQPTPGLQPAVELPGGPEGGLPPLPGPESDTPRPVSARPDTPRPVSARPDTPRPVSARPDTPQPDSRPDTPQPDSRPDTPQPDSRPDTPQPDSRPDPKSASTSSTCRRGRRKRSASAPGPVIEGLCDASAPAHATVGLGDASAPAHATVGLGDASAPAHATEGLSDASAPAHATEGLGDASAPAHATVGLGDASASVHATESFFLVLPSEPRDEGFEEEAPSDPVPEETKGSRRKCRRTLFLKGSRNSLSSFWPLNPETRVCQAPLRPLKVRQALLQAPRVLLAHSLSMRPWLTGACLNSVPAGDDLPVACLNSVPAGDDLPVARLNSVPAGDDVPVAHLNFVFVSWACQVCPAFSSSSGSNSPPGGNQWTAQPLSSSECPKRAAEGLTTQQQSQSSTSCLGCPGAKCTDEHPYA